MTLFTALGVLKVHVVRTTVVKLQDGYRKEYMNMLEKIASHICYNTHTSQVIRQFQLMISELSKEVLKIRR